MPRRVVRLCIHIASLLGSRILRTHDPVALLIDTITAVGNPTSESSEGGANMN